jgi:predicted RNA-binding protein with PUA-like domain
MRCWLMKSEPDVFSFDDLMRAEGRTTSWEGVRNYRARNFMKEMELGDRVLYYHSNADPPGVAGVAEVARLAYPDHTARDPSSDYYDPKATADKPIWEMVDIRAVAPLRRFVSLDELKADPRLAAMLVVQKGQRLSVMPVTSEELAVVIELGGGLG